MNCISKIILVVLFTTITVGGYAKSNGDLNQLQQKNNDTTIATTKSNIVIFKMIPTPTYTNSNNGGSLKKAGKVARTSNSHS